jgi:hypothetical protein
MGLIQKIRARHEAKKFEREIARVRQEATEAGQRHAEIVHRAEWAKAALATAENCGEDPDTIAKLSLAAAAAARELAESNERNLNQLAAGVEVSVRAEKS